MNLQPNDLRAPRGVRSLWINAENPTGAPGKAAASSSDLGPGRKGTPALPLPPGGRLTLADVEGPGLIRHIWMTVPDSTAANPFVLRNLVLRIYWDDEHDPSVEVPLGDFFCNGFGTRAPVFSEPIVVASTGGMNSYIPMPFRRRARIVLDSEHPDEIDMVFFQVDCTVGDEIADDTPYFHAQWRRSNASTALGEDHVILDDVRGSGRYLGTYIGVASLSRYWFGEGEVKFYIDGDSELPSLCSTGLEDYAGGAWGFQREFTYDPEPVPVTFNAPYCGYPLYSDKDTSKGAPFVHSMAPVHAMYRWHLPDPVWFDQDLRITLQQIGVNDRGLFERSDDVFSVAYWYQTEPHVAFPELPEGPAREPR